MGKGSKQRPTDHDVFSANFDAIFGSKEEYTYYYECSNCGKLTRDEVSKYEVIDREPYGDRTVDRVSYEVTCDKCGSDDVEEL